VLRRVITKKIKETTMSFLRNILIDAFLEIPEDIIIIKK
jgi:hypothetical protein